MKSKDLARELARQQKIGPAKAQDQIDRMVHEILERLRAGKPVKLPGLGELAARGRSAKP